MNSPPGTDAAEVQRRFEQIMEGMPSSTAAAAGTPAARGENLEQTVFAPGRDTASPGAGRAPPQDPQAQRPLAPASMPAAPMGPQGERGGFADPFHGPLSTPAGFFGGGYDPATTPLLRAGEASSQAGTSATERVDPYGMGALPPPSKAGRGANIFADLDKVMAMFPTMFTLFCFACFLVPIWITYHIGQDRNVQEWIAKKSWCVIFLPIAYLVTHAVHVVRGAPVKIAVILCTIGSSVVLLTVGNVMLLQAQRVGNVLLAQDCVTDLPKRDMQLAWARARDFYANCAARLARENNISFKRAVTIYRIGDCEGYAEAAGSEEGKWSYLGYLEEHYQCGGWCTSSQPLWTFHSTKDSCSSTVADVMFNKVQWSMLQAMIYVIIVLGFVSISFIALGPILRKQGLAW